MRSSSRPLNPFEEFGENFSISFDLIGSGCIAVGQLKAAIRSISKKYPFLLHICCSVSGQLEFTPIDDVLLTVRDGVVSSKISDEKICVLPKQMDWSKSNVFFELINDSTNGLFRLEILMSHSGSDGRSIFVIAHDLFLELTKSKDDPPMAKVNTLYDVISMLPKQRILELGPADVPYNPPRTLPQPPYEMHMPSEQLALKWRNDVWRWRFSEDDTAKLDVLAKQLRCSWQAFLTTATMLASWFIQQSPPNAELPDRVLAAPMFAQHLRQLAQPPLPDDVCVFGPAQVCFLLEMQSADTLAGLLARASTAIRVEIDQKHSGLRFFHPDVFCPHGGSTWASHVGRNPLQRRYGPIEILDCGLALGVNRIWQGGIPWGLTIHSHLSLGRLYLNVNTTSPLYSPAWSERYKKLVVAFYTTMLAQNSSTFTVHDFYDMLQTPCDVTFHSLQTLTAPMAHASLRYLPSTPEIVRFAHVGKVDEIKRVINALPDDGPGTARAPTPTGGSSTNVLQEAYLDLRTPLHVAAGEGHLDVVKYLLEQGVDPNPVDRWGGTPLQDALKNGHFQVAAVLRNALFSSLTVKGWNSVTDKARVALLHNVDLNLGLSSSLYGEGDNGSSCSRFIAALKAEGVVIATLKDIILAQCDEKDARALEDFVLRQFSVKAASADVQDKAELEQFKRRVVSGMGPEQLVGACTEKICIAVARSPEDQLVAVSHSVEPLTDLLSRSRQLITPRGVVLQKSDAEPCVSNILRFCFEKLGHKVILEVPPPLSLDGNDYVPAGEKLAFMGVGGGTCEATIRYLLRKDVFGCPVVAVVCDYFHRQHNLDSVMKIISPDTVLLAEHLVGPQNTFRRLVTEYVRVGDSRHYEVRRWGVELGEYLRELGFKIVPVSSVLFSRHSDIPLISLGGGRVLSFSESLTQLLESSKLSGIHVSTIQLTHGGPTPMNKFFNTRTYRSALLFRESAAGGPSLPPAGIPLTPAPSLDALWRPSTSAEVMHSTSHVLMVVPVGFQSNPETAADNYFMKRGDTQRLEDLERRALIEFSNLHRSLVQAGVNVVLVSNERFYNAPDAVFPNNWFTTHSEAEQKDSTVVLYPLKTHTRRNERRQYLVSIFQNLYDRERSFVAWEQSDIPHYLEGTGGLVLDRVHKIGYVALSQRANIQIAEHWARKLGYKLVTFRATDANGHPIYHTNVMMSVGTKLAIVCLETVEDPAERQNLLHHLSAHHKVLPITRKQMDRFCGNVLEVRDSRGTKILAMSSKAYAAFFEPELQLILQHVDRIVHSDIDTIETIGGGGVRCMLGELH